MAPQEEIARLKALLDTARSFGRAMDLGTLINEILDRSEEVMRAEGCSLLLPEPQTEDLIIHSTDARVAALPQPLKVPAGKGIAGAVFRSRTSLNIRDAQNDPRHYQGIGKQVGFVTRAILTIPLLDRSTCLGVLQALNPIGRDHFDAQDEEIFEGFGGLIAGALLRLEAQKREIERIQNEQEMLLAREIQDSFLPAGVQDFSVCQVHHQYLPAKVVGGDFYFVHPVVGRRILLGLGDVTGKGVPAALTMARASAMILAMAGQLGEDLGEWVTALNQQLVRDLRAGRFIGLTFLLADADAATLQICAAGQYAPFRFSGESWEPVQAPSHLPLGITSAASYASTRLPLNPGEFYLLFSDGIGEARNAAGEEFTTDGFLQKLPAGLTGAKLIPAATDAWRAFVGSAPQHDDVSLMLLDWRGLPPPPELDLSCCPETLGAGRAFIERWAIHAGYEDIVRGQIVLACDEAVTNVYRHAYGGCPGPLKLSVELQSGFLRVQLRDQGKPVDPGCIQGRDLSDLRPGGLGTVILSQVFDEVTFEPQDVGTILTLRKRLP